MKNFSYSLLVVALGFTIFAGCQSTGGDASNSASSAATMGNADSARLVIRRAPNMGTGLILNVSIDGKRAGSAARGQTYTGSLSPGAHVISVLLEPNGMGLTPTQKRITVQKGQTYTFNATWNGNVLGLE